ncbi:hypothetical protein MKX01_041595 [Papaver californicum]|nr:hypothetical protein MKX01_041595 [Papaver californicum]
MLVRRCPDSPCTIGGYTIPKGAKVIFNVWGMHMDAEAWSNPSEFLPERFLTNTPDNMKKYDYRGNNFNYLPFGSGRRVCVGISLAERMVTYLSATLLHSFNWRLPEGTKLDLTGKFGIVSRKATPLVAVPTPRFSNPELYVIHVIVLNSSSATKEVFRYQNANFFGRHILISALIISYGGKDIIWGQSDQEWRKLWKILTHELLINTSLDFSYSLRRSEIRRMVKDVYGMIGTPINVGEQVFVATLNVVLNMLWGGTIQGDERIRVGIQFRQLFNEMIELGLKPNVADFFLHIFTRFDIQGIEKKSWKIFGEMDQMFDSVIDQHLKLDKENNGQK